MESGEDSADDAATSGRTDHTKSRLSEELNEISSLISKLNREISELYRRRSDLMERKRHVLSQFSVVRTCLLCGEVTPHFSVFPSDRSRLQQMLERVRQPQRMAAADRVLEKLRARETAAICSSHLSEEDTLQQLQPVQPVQPVQSAQPVQPVQQECKTEKAFDMKQPALQQPARKELLSAGRDDREVADRSRVKKRSRKSAAVISRSDLSEKGTQPQPMQPVPPVQPVKPLQQAQLECTTGDADDAAGRSRVKKRSRKAAVICSRHPSEDDTQSQLQPAQPLQPMQQDRKTEDADDVADRSRVKKRSRKAAVICSNHPSEEGTQPQPQQVSPVQPVKPQQPVQLECTTGDADDEQPQQQPSAATCDVCSGDEASNPRPPFLYAHKSRPVEGVNLLARLVDVKPEVRAQLARVSLLGGAWVACSRHISHRAAAQLQEAELTDREKRSAKGRKAGKHGRPPPQPRPNDERAAKGAGSDQGS